jgi:hypothetical protein
MGSLQTEPKSESIDQRLKASIDADLAAGFTPQEVLDYVRGWTSGPAASSRDESLYFQVETYLASKGGA